MSIQLLHALCTVVLACIDTMSGAAADDAVKSKPNLVFILADDLGYGELGCCGQTVIQTPRLDQMAMSVGFSTNCRNSASRKTRSSSSPATLVRTIKVSTI